jgi:hypothetical protein
MMRWSELERQQPHLAALGRERLIEPGVVLVGTIRRDGSPRISPVEPLLWEGELWLSTLYDSLKAADLIRDSRVLVHGIVTSRDGAASEYKVRGRRSSRNHRIGSVAMRMKSQRGLAGRRSLDDFTSSRSTSRT